MLGTLLSQWPAVHTALLRRRGWAARTRKGPDSGLSCVPGSIGDSMLWKKMYIPSGTSLGWGYILGLHSNLLACKPQRALAPELVGKEENLEKVHVVTAAPSLMGHLCSQLCQQPLSQPPQKNMLQLRPAQEPRAHCSCTCYSFPEHTMFTPEFAKFSTRAGWGRGDSSPVQHLILLGSKQAQTRKQIFL